MRIRTTRAIWWRKCQLAALLTAVFGAFMLIGQVPAAEQPKLQDRLEKGLRARTPEEMAFLGRVVDSVEERRLPESLIDRVFFWARKKAEKQEGPRRRRPMIYFQPAMTVLAARMGVNLE